MSKRTPISGIVHTYNAGRYLDACLSCLADVDEILVVDMESTDDTVEIARRHGARVIVKPRGEHRIAEAYRDFAIHAATHPWVLVVDADELVPQALIDYLRAQIDADPSPRGFQIPIKNYFMGRWMKCYYPAYILRFFNRDGATWPYQVHSRPNHLGPVVTIPASRTDLAFVHLANESMAESIAKLNAYTDREADRRAPGSSRIKLFTDPPFRFFKAFVLKGGFRDGWPGFIHAVHDAVYRFATLAKIEEKRHSATTDSDICRDRRAIEQSQKK